MIDQNILKHTLEYNPDTGLFTRRIPICGHPIGSVAGSKNNKGYICISIRGTSYKAHRLAFLYMNGEFPIEQVDHINLDKADNRFCNLRQITNAENQKNKSIYRNNTSGANGICFDKRSNKWRARLYKNGRRIHIGFFKSVEEANIARQNYINNN